MPACFLGDEFEFRSWIFSTIQWTNCIDGTVGCTIRFVFEKWADVWQLAARSAIDALTFTLLRYGQYRSTSPSDSGTPCIRLSIRHVKEHTLIAKKFQAIIRDSFLLIIL